MMPWQAWVVAAPFVAMLLPYARLMWRFGQGMRRVPALPPALPFAALPSISVLVPFRNEAQNLPALLNALAAQSLPKNQWELLLIDDHSTDGGGTLAANLAHQLGLNCRVLPLAHGRPGLPPFKKGAVTLGVEAATHPLILCTDADCLPHPQWLARLATPFALNAHLQMLCGPVDIKVSPKSKNIFEHFQQTEFAMLVGLGAAGLALGRPAMCNGANLAYRKQAFLDVNGYAGNEHQASGDDEFLMHKLWAARPGSVQFVLDADVLVQTAPQPSLQAFVAQRVRWGGKGKHYTDGRILQQQLFVAALNVGLLLFFVTCLFVPALWPAFGMVATCKWLAEWPFVLPFSRKHLHPFAFLAKHFLFQPMHILYIAVVGALTLRGSYEWKGRVHDSRLRKQAS